MGPKTYELDVCGSDTAHFHETAIAKKNRTVKKTKGNNLKTRLIKKALTTAMSADRRSCLDVFVNAIFILGTTVELTINPEITKKSSTPLQVELNLKGTRFLRGSIY